MIYIWSEIEADVFMQPGPLEREMSRDQAYELMRDVLKGLLPSLETIARTAKNTPPRRT
jgi:hypothetical protein